MRRYSLLLGAALILISAAVGYTLKLRWEKARAAHVAPTPAIRPVDEGVALSGWQYKKDDPQTNKPVVRVDARAFEGTNDPSTFELNGVRLRLYDKKGGSYTYVKTEQALFDQGSGVLKSQAPVFMVIHVPAAKNAEDPAIANKHVRVNTSGIVYETKTGRATTNDKATFIFTEGDGTGVGAEYDPNSKVLHLRSQIALDWIGKGSADRKIHIEAGDLIYKEAEGKIYLSPWSRMTRETTRIDAKNTLVTIENHHLHQIDGEHAVGTNDREDRHTAYSADTMTALFDPKGNLTQVLGKGHARVDSKQPGADTVITGKRANLQFALETEQKNGKPATESQLHLVTADGESVAESTPLSQPGKQLAETRILRSEHIELEMKPGGSEVEEIRSPVQAQLEFKPNRAEQSHRIIDASRLRVLYGAGSYVDTFVAWKAATHTDKASALAKPKRGPDGKLLPPAPALTWSDLLIAKFLPNSNSIASIDQSGNFRYQEGTRKAWAKRARLEQTINRITLNENARVLDETGSAAGDRIVMNQANGDMDATGHVLSTHEPDRNEKPGTSMLDATQPMQARADQMQTRDDNSKVYYEGHVVMWQAANRISADAIVIDRDGQSLDAAGNVVTELMDSKGADSPVLAVASAAGVPGVAPAAPSNQIYTIVRAPKLSYRDNSRIATYTDGVKLVRDKMTIQSNELVAYLTPKSENTKNDSSLDHAIATGKVNISDEISPGRTRTGTGEHCEYFTKNDKVVLNGGLPQMVDSHKGVIKGQQLTYYSNADRLIVDGKKDQIAFTRMKKTK